jgi:hypothetical protein
MDKQDFNRLRQPHPEQEAIDARSARLLRSSQRYLSSRSSREHPRPIERVGGSPHFTNPQSIKLGRPA